MPAIASDIGYLIPPHMLLHIGVQKTLHRCSEPLAATSKVLLVLPSRVRQCRHKTAEQLSTVVDEYYDGIPCIDQARDCSTYLKGLSLPIMDLAHLKVPFIVEEINKAVRSMPMDSCGPCQEIA